MMTASRSHSEAAMEVLVNDFGTRFDVHRVLVVDRLNVPERRVNFRELQEKWPHFADL